MLTMSRLGQSEGSTFVDDGPQFNCATTSCTASNDLAKEAIRKLSVAINQASENAGFAARLDEADSSFGFGVISLIANIYQLALSYLPDDMTEAEKDRVTSIASLADNPDTIGAQFDTVQHYFLDDVEASTSLVYLVSAALAKENLKPPADADSEAVTMTISPSTPPPPMSMQRPSFYSRHRTAVLVGGGIGLALAAGLLTWAFWPKKSY